MRRNRIQIISWWRFVRAAAQSCLVGGLSWCMSAFGADSPVVLVVNAENNKELPNRFRSTKILEQFTEERKGLEGLRLSGSGQFSVGSLEVLVDRLGHPNNLYVLDLRAEEHGFLNGAAVSWCGARNQSNRGKSASVVLAKEQERLKQLQEYTEVEVHRVRAKNNEQNQLPSVEPEKWKKSSVESEQQLLARHGISYFRLAVTDHQRPSDEVVDQWLSWVKQLPKDRWVHVHCAGGAGRTTTFLVLFDCLFNAKELSFEQILQRQMALGGGELYPDHKASWKRADAEARMQFLKAFHRYAKEVGPQGEKTWSAWSRFCEFN